jgi:hypothetical protein
MNLSMLIFLLQIKVEVLDLIEKKFKLSVGVRVNESECCKLATKSTILGRMSWRTHSRLVEYI